jgi:hypothetical protein
MITRTDQQQKTSLHSAERFSVYVWGCREKQINAKKQGEILKW